jgi:hypothetical protein
VDNYIVTATGGEKINGESNLTFDGSTLVVTSSIYLNDHLKIGDNGGITLGGGKVLYLDSGIYSPEILGATASCTMTSWAPTIYDSCAQWMRVGQIVNVSGEINMLTQNGAAGNIVAVSIELPFLPTGSTGQKFTNTCQVAGTGVSDCGTYGAYPYQLYGRVYAEIIGTADKAILEFENVFNGAENILFSFHFTYRLIS